MHHCPHFGSDVVQDLDETGKTQVRDLTPPQGFHALEVQGFEADDDRRSDRGSVRSLPVEVTTQMSHPAMHTGEVRFGSAPVTRPWTFRRELSVGPGNLPESMS